MAKIIVYSEKTQLALELLTAAKNICTDIYTDILMITVNDEKQAVELAAQGLAVCNLIAPAVHAADTAGMSMILQKAADQLGIKVILLASNRRGKELSGRLAQAWGAGCLTDVKTIQNNNEQLIFTRNTLGGATVATQRIQSEKKVIAVSPRSFAAWSQTGQGSIHDMEIAAVSSIEVVEVKEKAADSVDIQAADRLIVVGQGIENQEQLALVEKIARALDAEVACSKPVATDRKWFAEDRIIGLSGKICKPELAITLGVSGQVQFMVGIRESKTIISINNDENADLNKMADYVLAADLNQVLPEMEKALE